MNRYAKGSDLFKEELKKRKVEFYETYISDDCVWVNEKDIDKTLDIARPARPNDYPELGLNEE